METQVQIKRYGWGMSLFLAFGVLALPLSTTQTAHGDIVTLRVTGTVTRMNSFTDDAELEFDLDGSVVIGSPYELTFVLDTDAPDLEPGPVKGRYVLLASSGQLGNYTWSATEPSVWGIRTTNDLESVSGPVDAYDLLQFNIEFSGMFLLGGEPTLFSDESFENLVASIDLTDYVGNALDSDALVIPSLTDWSRKNFSMRFQLDDTVVGFLGVINVDGTVDSITIIPEPGAAAVVGLFLAAHTVRRRRLSRACTHEIRSSV